MRWSAWLGLAMGLAAGASLHADPAAGLQDFKAGQSFQAARQWGNAVRQYLKCLQDDPKAYWAYKALGTVYYQAGDHRGALAYYQRYLALYPSDTATQAFASRLRTELGTAAPAGQPTAPADTAQARPAESGPSSHGGFSLRVEGAAVMDSGADLVAGSIGPNQTASTPGGLAPGYGLGVDYSTDTGFVVGLEAMDGPIRNDTVTITVPFGSVAEKVTVNNTTVGLNAGWSIGVGRHILIQPNLELGYMMSTLTVANASGSDTASGFEAWPKLRGEYVWGSWGLGLDLGYLWAQLKPVKGPNGKDVQQTSSSGSTSTWVMDNGGLSFGLYAAYHFNPPL
jgi:hypothetical protein